MSGLKSINEPLHPAEEPKTGGTINEPPGSNVQPAPKPAPPPADEEDDDDDRHGRRKRK